MKYLLILQGIPASGKSTFAKEFVKGKPNWVIINKDSLRNMRGVYWQPKQEDFIEILESAFTREALLYGQNIIIDATNLSEHRVNKFRTLIRETNPDYKILQLAFPISKTSAFIRDDKREQKVGTSVILDFYNEKNSYVELMAKTHNSETFKTLNYCPIDLSVREEIHKLFRSNPDIFMKHKKYIKGDGNNILDWLKSLDGITLNSLYKKLKLEEFL